MKTLSTLKIHKVELVCVVETLPGEEIKAHVDYFINGYHVTDWAKIKPEYQQLFNVMADVICSREGLIKWSY